MRTVWVLGLGLTILLGPATADAQPSRKVWRIGFLVPAAHPPSWTEGFRQALRDLGYVEGQNVVIEWRHAEGRKDLGARLLEELVRLKVDVIVTWTTPAARAAQRATNTIPIVAYTGDPVRTGLVASLARPGGNVTGIAILTEELEVKALELLKEAVPTAVRIGLLWNPANPVWAASLKDLQNAAQALRVNLLLLEAADAGQVEKAFAAAVRGRAGALLVPRDGLFTQHSERIVELAAQTRLPAMYGGRQFTDAGGLLAYGVTTAKLFGRLASYVDKILKGARPADLPVEQPTEFELTVNLKTAKALGLVIPRSLLIRADEVIQ